ncbi:related to mitochondrial p32 family protein [Serendipita indica DSM 11827]|uniref:Related to mitochondrial p32 family protein n=2 Tax=Serendipita indica (strain DSM 11827) TaxID=1109443 RepID=G4TQY5_SERID|nr:related to mitochondrial p32 family protein [Serendipita indica DSM 11827]
MNSSRILRVTRNVSRFAQPVSSFSTRAARLAPSTSLQKLASPSHFARTFSISARAFADTATNKTLLETLTSELNHEKENAAEDPAVPEFIEEFQKSGNWSIEQKPGHDEVFLVKKHGNETVQVSFAISDIDNSEMFEEDLSEEEDVDTAFPVRCSITVSKPSGGALAFEAVAQHGMLQIENVAYYQDGKLATELTPEAEFKRRGTYAGPMFDHLDQSLQEAFEEYLKARKVDSDLALFIPEYAAWKEQQEYVSWLDGVKNFVQA